MRSDWKLLISAAEIAARIAETAAAIEARYAGEEMVMVGILHGAMFFMSDLARAIHSPVRVDSMLLRSYGGGMTSAGKVEMRHDVSSSVAGKHVLLVDDILDSGRTLRFAADHLTAKGPKSLEIACLLDKDVPRAAEVDVRYKLIRIANEFVVGYGLDLDGLGRNLPDIWAVPEGTSEQAAKNQLAAQLSLGLKLN